MRKMRRVLKAAGGTGREKQGARSRALCMCKCRSQELCNPTLPLMWRNGAVLVCSQGHESHKWHSVLCHGKRILCFIKGQLRVLGLFQEQHVSD